MSGTRRISKFPDPGTILGDVSVESISCYFFVEFTSFADFDSFRSFKDNTGKTEELTFPGLSRGVCLEPIFQNLRPGLKNVVVFRVFASGTRVAHIVL